jgi:hypothetical protein
MRLFALVAGAAVLLLAGGSAIAGSPADQGTAGTTCLTDATDLVPVVATPKGKLSRVLAPGVVKEAIELKNAHGTALNCAAQAEKPAQVPVDSGELEQPAWLIREMAGGPPHCSAV